MPLTESSGVVSLPLSHPSSMQTNVHHMQTRAKVDTYKPCHLLKFPHPLIQDVPTCVSTTTRDLHWKTSMAEEYNVVVANRTWDLVPPDPNKNLVGCKWVLQG